MAKETKKYFHPGNAYGVSLPKRYTKNDPDVKSGTVKEGELVYLKDPLTGQVIRERDGVTPKVARRHIKFHEFNDGSKLKDGYFCVYVLNENDPKYVEEYLDKLLEDSASLVTDYDGYIKSRTPDKFSEMIKNRKLEQDNKAKEDKIKALEAQLAEINKKPK